MAAKRLAAEDRGPQECTALVCAGSAVLCATFYTATAWVIGYVCQRTRFDFVLRSNNNGIHVLK